MLWGQGRTEGGRKGIFKMLRFSITKAIQTHCVNPWLSLVHPSQAGHKRTTFLKIHCDTKLFYISFRDSARRTWSYRIWERIEGRADSFRMPPCIFPNILFFCIMTLYDFHHTCFWCRSLKKFGINIMNKWINTAQSVGRLWAIVIGLCEMSVSEQQYSALLLVSPWSEPSIVWTMTKRMWFCLISYFSTDLFLFLSMLLLSHLSHDVWIGLQF